MIPVLLGAVLYYCFCPDVYFVKVVDRIVRTQFHLNISRRIFLPPLIRGYLFDFLWSYSLTGIIYLLIGYGNHSALVVIIPLCLGAVMEILQLIGFASGTADFFDVLVEVTGIITANHITREDEK